MADALLRPRGRNVRVVYVCTSYYMYALHPFNVLAVLCYGVMYYMLYLYWLNPFYVHQPELLSCASQYNQSPSNKH